jgi:hypothetical protein
MRPNRSALRYVGILILCLAVFSLAWWGLEEAGRLSIMMLAAPVIVTVYLVWQLYKPVPELDDPSSDGRSQS